MVFGNNNCRYSVMLQCWHDSPGLRLSFSDLVSELDRILAVCVAEVLRDITLSNSRLLLLPVGGVA